MEAANLGGLPGRAPGDRVDEAVAALAEVPTFRPSVDAWLRPRARVRRPGRRPARLARHPDLALRPRAAQRLRHGDREVLPQRHPRGDPARGLRRRDRVPPRRRRHRPGGLPGRLRELLRRRVLGRADGAGRRAYWTETLPAWPLLTALARGRPWRSTSTSSTTSTRPPTSSATGRRAALPVRDRDRRGSGRSAASLTACHDRP